jgi:hypothetical protein
MKALKSNLILFFLLAGGVFAFSQCTKQSVNDGVQNQSDTKSPSQGTFSQTGNANGTGVCTGNGTGNSNGKGNRGAGSDYLFSCITSLPVETLTTSEINALNTMREEELLAHDVYIMLYSVYKIPVFNNISQAETQHTEAVKTLLLKYSLPDPALNHVAGVFVNPDLQALYTSLVTQGKASLIAALTVGATIEDLDINDLHNHIAADVDNQDILFVFGNLEKGSRNHLRAFNRLLTAKGITYTPQYISVEYFNQIISSAQETGSVVCPN